MSEKPMDRLARKQVLLTRIAFDRTQLRNDLARAGEAVRLPNLLHGVFGAGLVRSLFGVPSPRNQGGWVGLSLSLLKRYRVAAALVGAAAPIVRGARGWRRWLRVAGLGAAGLFSWRYVQKRNGARS